MKLVLQLPVFALSAVVLLAGCKTLDPYTGEEKLGNTSKGAMIGAGIGAVAGVLSGKDSRDRKRRALLGAGIGGLTGAGVGAYMDKQEAELRQQLQGTGVSVSRDGENITLNMPSNITFKSGSADLNSRFFQVLDGVGLVLQKYNQTLVEIAGHTDNIGSTADNQRLSEARAGTVANYLSGKGISQSRTIVIGGGESHPVASNATEEGRSANRRVEINLLPIKQS